jgi:hypothetical protein
MTVQVQDYYNAPWRAVAIPRNCKDLVFLNLQSMGGGMSSFWGKSGGANSYGWQPASAADGLIEVVAMPENVYKMAATKLLCSDRAGVRIAQAHAVRVTSEAATYMQIDGEPWRQPPCKFEISHAVNGSGEAEKAVVLQGLPVGCCCMSGDCCCCGGCFFS